MKSPPFIAETPSLFLSFPLTLKEPSGADVLELGLFGGILGLWLLEWTGGPVCGQGVARLVTIWAVGWPGWGAAGPGVVHSRVQLESMALVKTSVHPEWDPWLWHPSRPGSNLSLPPSILGSLAGAGPHCRVDKTHSQSKDDPEPPPTNSTRPPTPSLRAPSVPWKLG